LHFGKFYELISRYPFLCARFHVLVGFLPQAAIWARRLPPFLEKDTSALGDQLNIYLDDEQTLIRVDGAHRVQAWTEVNEERRASHAAGIEDKPPCDELCANILPDDTTDGEMEMFALHINMLNDVYEPMNLPDLCYHVYKLSQQKNKTLTDIADQLGTSMRTFFLKE